DLDVGGGDEIHDGGFGVVGDHRDVADVMEVLDGDADAALDGDEAVAAEDEGEVATAVHGDVEAAVGLREGGAVAGLVGVQREDAHLDAREGSAVVAEDAPAEDADALEIDEGVERGLARIG